MGRWRCELCDLEVVSERAKPYAAFDHAREVHEQITAKTFADYLTAHFKEVT